MKFIATYENETGEGDTPNEAFNDLQDQLDFDDYGIEEVLEVEICEKHNFTFSDFLDVSGMLEKISEEAYDNAGECAEDYLSDVTGEMESELKNLILDWANRHNLEPRFYEIGKVVETRYINVDGKK